MLTHILDKKTPKNYETLLNKLESLDPTIKHVITIKTFTEKRSDLQNSLSHSWYSELAFNLKENDALGYKCFCKLHFGVGILRAEDEEFRTAYDLAIKPMSYEKKLEVMKILPVTSIMNTKQLTQYLDAMKSYFYDNHGFDLKYPNGY